MRCLLALLALVAAAAADHIKPSDFPRISHRAQWFEARVNAPQAEIRKRVVTEVCYFFGRDEELVRFLRRMVRDSDPVVRGRAILELYRRWILLEPKDLPRTFSGYSDDQIINRDDPDHIDKLQEHLHGDGPGPGWAVYSLGILRAKEALPRIRMLKNHTNVYVRYAAARAMLACGDRDNARAVFDAISSEQLETYAGAEGERHPWYAWNACRGLIEIGGDEGYQRALKIWRHLELSSGVNDRSKLPYIRIAFADLAGQYFATAKEAQAWFETDRRKTGR